MSDQYQRFDVEEYRKRLVVMRMLFGEGQVEFAKRLGIPFKKWNHYERGYPLPRETVWTLNEKIPGICPRWLWFGRPHGLDPDLRKRIVAIEQQMAQQRLELQREAAHLLRQSKQRKPRKVRDQVGAR